MALPRHKIGPNGKIMSESPPKSTNGKNKKPRREDLFCTLCHVQTNSFKLLSAHLSGKLHSRKHRDRTLLNRIKDVRGWDRGLTRNRSPGVSSESQGQSLADAEELDPFFCVICALRLNSGPQMESHLLGSKHLKRSSQPKATTWSQSTNPELPDFIISLETGRGYKCKTCNLALNSVPQVFGHISSLRHQNEAMGTSIPKQASQDSNYNPSQVGHGSNFRQASPPNGTWSQNPDAFKPLQSSFCRGGQL